MTKHTVGIDISKDRLDAFRASDRGNGRFSNDAAGFRELIDWMGTEIDCVGYEPTGPWHMPALAAIRFNPDMTRTYQNLKDAGKPSKVAITAVMRKLIVLANALLQQDRIWQPRDTQRAA